MTEHGVKDRVVIVTGAGRGIGRGVALHLAKNGAKVVAAEYRQHRLDDVLADLKEVGEPNLGVICDVGEQERVSSTTRLTSMSASSAAPVREKLSRLLTISLARKVCLTIFSMMEWRGSSVGICLASIWM